MSKEGRLGESEKFKFQSAEPGKNKVVGKDQNPDDETRDMAFATDSRQEYLRQQIEAQDLPVKNRLDELEAALVKSAGQKGILLLQGETGSGKSIYSPVAMRRALRKLGLPDRTVMMQPRRDAASGIGRATAAIMREKLGKGVGFSTSESKTVQEDSALRVVTPGIFLRYIQEGGLTKQQVGAIIRPVP